MNSAIGISVLVILGIGILLILWIIGVYNGLIVKRNQYRNAFSQIDVQLKRRYDLIPNLVETAKGYMKHEQETLEKVIKARNIAAGALQNAAADQTSPDLMKQLGNADGSLTGALGRLMVVVEQYPDLKANQNMLLLQEELTSTENKVAFSRQAYNDSVMLYNNACETFPANIIAGTFNFSAAVSFEIENPLEKEVPKVQF